MDDVHKWRQIFKQNDYYKIQYTKMLIISSNNNNNKKNNVKIFVTKKK